MLLPAIHVLAEEALSGTANSFITFTSRTISPSAFHTRDIEPLSDCT